MYSKKYIRCGTNIMLGKNKYILTYPGSCNKTCKQQKNIHCNNQRDKTSTYCGKKNEMILPLLRAKSICGILRSQMLLLNILYYSCSHFINIEGFVSRTEGRSITDHYKTTGFSAGCATATMLQ